MWHKNWPRYMSLCTRIYNREYPIIFGNFRGGGRTPGTPFLNPRLFLFLVDFKIAKILLNNYWRLQSRIDICPSCFVYDLWSNTKFCSIGSALTKHPVALQQQAVSVYANRLMSWTRKTRIKHIFWCKKNL